MSASEEMRGEEEAAVEECVVMKFGGSVLRDERDLPRAVHEIYRVWRNGARVVAVVSALGDTTDRLLEQAARVADDPEPRALATLLATGELTSAALLALALDRAGVPHEVFDAAQVGLRTAGERLEAQPVSVDLGPIERAHARGAVVVLPGFIGRDAQGAPTLLGRGGSDLTALFLAQHLRARCVLFKDVDGLYTADPARSGDQRPRRFARAHWGTALAVGGEVVQPKAVRFAAEHGMSFAIKAPCTERWTEIGAGPDALAADERTRPLRVALLGCGTVGGGVYARLAALGERFAVVGVAARTPQRALAAGVPAELFAEDAWSLVEGDGEVVVELIGGVEPAAALVEEALRAGKHVVTANKALLAERGARLAQVAAAHGVELRYSAAVGGAVPATEMAQRARRLGTVYALEAVLNGTTNFVLDQLARGADWEQAVRAAQAAGYAEADPRLDLDGTDAAHKLALLVRLAFGVDLDVREVAREGIDGVEAERVRRAHAVGRAVRLVARAVRCGERVEAGVRPLELAAGHPLAAVTGVENRLIIELEDGRRLEAGGKGAGRWPTAEAVMADLFDIARVNDLVEECVA